MAGKHSGCLMWAGSDYDYNGIKCTFTKTLDVNMTYEDRIETAFSWFSDENTPANLVMMYFEEPDEHAHAFGPDSAEVCNGHDTHSVVWILFEKLLSSTHGQVTAFVAKLDKAVGYIQKRLIETGLDKRVNVIYLSDHGMNSVTPPNFINLNEFLSDDCCTMYGTSPILQIVPKDFGVCVCVCMKCVCSLMAKTKSIYTFQFQFQPKRMKFSRI